MWFQKNISMELFILDLRNLAKNCFYIFTINISMLFLPCQGFWNALIFALNVSKVTITRFILVECYATCVCLYARAPVKVILITRTVRCATEVSKVRSVWMLTGHVPPGKVPLCVKNSRSVSNVKVPT
jgi:hypothetical protein